MPRLWTGDYYNEGMSNCHDILSELHEECGVFGVFNLPNASTLTYYGLHALQHRGEESAGICTTDLETGRFRSHRDMGLVKEVFDKDHLKMLAGNMAIGHVRYSTAGESKLQNAQPLVFKYRGGDLAVATNGNILNSPEIRAELEEEGSIFQTTSDTEVIAHLIARSKKSFYEAARDALERLIGGFAFLLMTNDTLLIASDRNGIRPLVMGKMGEGYVFASESCAFETIGAEFVRDIEPGELLKLEMTPTLASDQRATAREIIVTGEGEMRKGTVKWNEQADGASGNAAGRSPRATGAAVRHVTQQAAVHRSAATQTVQGQGGVVASAIAVIDAPSLPIAAYHLVAVSEETKDQVSTESSATPPVTVKMMPLLTVDRFTQPSRRATCAMEYIYFARPDSDIHGVNLHLARKQMGRIMAQEAFVDADVVTGVPDSSISAAIGYAEQTGIPYELGLIKNKYTGRTFIQPSQELREQGVKMKLSAVRKVVEGKRVVMIDDSIVRGTTSLRIVQLLRDAGATEVHVRITSPPFMNPCYYGIDTPSRRELIAANKSVDEIRRAINADSLVFLTPRGLMEAVGGFEGHINRGMCMACFDNDYPTEITANANDSSC
jgi:amidophosphoribosyltransferase